MEKRLRTLEDIVEITELKAAYCNYADGGWDRLTHDYDGVASLFVEDGVWDGGGVGRGDGREGIRTMFKAIRNIPFAFHRVTNPIIKVQGDTATGNWHVLVPLTQPDGQSYWIAGIYDDEFVRTPDGWKFKLLSWKPAFITPFEKPWGKGEYYRRESAGTGDGGQEHPQER